MTEQQKEFLYKEIGERIRDLRRGLELNQEQFSIKVGLKRSSVVNIEKGRQHPPLHTLFDIAIGLKVSVDKLLPDVPEAKPTEDLSTKFQDWAKKQGLKNEQKEIVITALEKVNRKET